MQKQNMQCRNVCNTKMYAEMYAKMYAKMYAEMYAEMYTEMYSMQKCILKINLFQLELELKWSIPICFL